MIRSVTAASSLRPLVLSAWLAATGCSSSAPFGQAVDSLRSALGSTDVKSVSREQSDRLPYASLLGAIGDAPPALLILANAQGAERAWVSADQAMLVTKHGRVVKTVGLKSNLHEVRSLMPDPVQSGLHRLAPGTTYSRTLDIMPGYQFGTLAQSEFRRLGLEAVDILDQSHRLMHVEELVSFPEFHTTLTNDFWVDANTGFVWKSRQHLTPDLPPVNLELTKPFARDLQP